MRVAVISEVRLYREGLCEILAKREGIEIVGTAARVADASARIRELEQLPDVVLVDIGEPTRIDDLRQLAEDLPSLRIVAITVPDRARDVIACAESGVAGFVTRDASLAELVEALESAVRGEVVVPPRITAVLLRHVTSLARERTDTTRLTNREREILSLINAGLSNKSIAEALCIELPTVKNHVHRILEKLGVTNRMQAAAWLRTRSVA
jgi:two-component system nitrate/nitrite response regulator NarL